MFFKDNYLRGTGSGPTWYVDIDPPKRKVLTYYKETLKAVEYVYANKTGKFTVLFSGGLDSQYVCEVLLRLKIEFDIVIVNYLNREKQSYNNHDIKYAFEFCNSRNLKYKTIDVNFEELVESGEAVRIARSVQCRSLTYCHLLCILKKIDGFILLGNDPPYIRYEKEKNSWALLIDEFDFGGLVKYFEKYNVEGCPFLLAYTAEMMLSFLIDPSICKLGTGQFPGKLGSNSTKSLVFNNGSNLNMPNYDFTNGPRIKFNGFENILRSEINQHSNLKIFKDFYNIWNGEYLEPYTDAVTRLSVYQ